jgi:hypothetical protein
VKRITRAERPKPVGKTDRETGLLKQEVRTETLYNNIRQYNR